MKNLNLKNKIIYFIGKHLCFFRHRYWLKNKGKYMWGMIQFVKDGFDNSKEIKYDSPLEEIISNLSDANKVKNPKIEWYGKHKH